MARKSPPPLRQQIARRLRDLRKASGLTQGELAELIGECRNTICNWERGAECYDVLNLYDMADALGLPVRSFLPGEEPREDASSP